VSLQSSRELAPGVIAFEVALDRPLSFEAGQFALFEVPHIAGARSYSMVNFARDTSRLHFVVKRFPGGRLSEWLFGPVDRRNPRRDFWAARTCDVRSRDRQACGLYRRWVRHCRHDVDSLARRGGRLFRPVRRPRFLRRQNRSGCVLPRRTRQLRTSFRRPVARDDRSLARGSTSRNCCRPIPNSPSTPDSSTKPPSVH
jgi:hypothetical protein